MAIGSFDRLRSFQGISRHFRSLVEEKLQSFGRAAPKNPSPAKRIVIYRLGSLGDTIVALPCFHKIAQAFPGAERFVLTNAPVSSKAAPLASLLSPSGLIDGVVDYPVGLRDISKLVGLARELRALETSTLVYLTVPRGRLSVYRDIAFFRLCGFKRIIGAPVTTDLLVRQPDQSTGLLEQECKRLARSLRALGPVDLEDRANWDLHLTEEERAIGAHILEPFGNRAFIGLNMGGKAAENHWGSANWRALLADLASTHGGYGILAVGVSDEAPDVDLVTRAWPGPVINACGRLSPRETAAALEKAAHFMGHDTGPMHLAAACGISCVALFGSRNRPATWHPFGAGHRIIHRLEGIEAISVGEVAAIVREVVPALAAEKALS